MFDRPCWLDAGPDNPPTKHVIRDMTNSGAKLCCDNPDIIPDEFNLYFTPDRSVRRGCRVVWRSGHDLGLVFLNRGPQPQFKEGNEDIVEV